jgi:two-component system sensor kinase FixL
VALLGELSAALAHELNQPLTAILSNAQAAQRFLQRDGVDLQDIREILQDIVDEDKRASEVIRRLRALFMKDDPRLQPLDLNELVRETLALARSDLARREITVSHALAPGVCIVDGDRVQLQQVLLNLIINAGDAMAAVAPVQRRLSVSTTVASNGGVRVAISDSGPGIHADAIDRIFESFYTTKKQGLGFGLSISRSIIEQHGGRIEAENNPQGGATFNVILPAHPGMGT